jgi:hypothetical protein
MYCTWVRKPDRLNSRLWHNTNVTPATERTGRGVPARIRTVRCRQHVQAVRLILGADRERGRDREHEVIDSDSSTRIRTKATSEMLNQNTYGTSTFATFA